MLQIKNWDNINPIYWADKVKDEFRTHRKELNVAALIAAAIGTQAVAYGYLAHETNKPVNR